MGGGEDRVLSFGNVELVPEKGEEAQNVAEMVVARGFASLVKHRSDEVRVCTVHGNCRKPNEKKQRSRYDINPCIRGAGWLLSLSGGRPCSTTTCPVGAGTLIHKLAATSVLHVVRACRTVACSGLPGGLLTDAVPCAGFCCLFA